MPSDGMAAKIRRRFNASPRAVFAAFSDPALVRRWLTPDPRIRLEILAFDFRVGGGYRFGYHVPGMPVMHVNGVFQVIEPPGTLVFSWNIEPPDEHARIESEVRVTITPDGAGTELQIHHVNLSRAGAPERHSEGWRGALDQLAMLLDNDPRNSKKEIRP
jgi:uncharacterized protein YndB with AHSA1/START domain